MGGVALCSTGGSSYNNLVIMTQSGNSFLRSENCVTDGAVSTFGQARCGTCGSHGDIYDLGMALRLGSDVEIEATVSGSLPSVLIGTRSGTGRCLGSGLSVIRGSQLG